MTTTRIYRSTDTDAPVLTGQVGSLLNLLDKCLVDGYTGKTAAGWTRPYTGTNKTAYRNSVAAGGSGMYLRVVDANAGYATAKVFSAMSDVDTGSDVAPAAAYSPDGRYWAKSVTSDATARPWVLVADELTMWLIVQQGAPGTYVFDSLFGAGDFASEVPADPWRYFVLGRTNATSAGAGGVGSGGDLRLHPGNFGTVTPGSTEALWIARQTSGSGASIATRCLAFGSAGDVAFGTTNTANIAAPSPGGGHEYWINAMIADSSTIRGRLRGIQLPITQMGTVPTFTARDDMPWAPAGNRMIIARHSAHQTVSQYSSNNLGAAAIETALEWD